MRTYPEFIRNSAAYTSRRAGDLFNQPEDATNFFAVGLGSGLLAASAVASSPSLSALIPLGIEVVLIAFRLGMYVGATARHLESARDGADCWSYTVDGTNHEEAATVVSELHKTQVCFTTSS